ncbi:MAG TPA: hypothetical protein VFT70_08095 [Nocardioides sp.]|nr:hypothetical protein [Nocardioides sp.]
MAGPQKARLDRALAGAADDTIELRANEWEKCKGILSRISLALATASPEVKERIGGKTGPAIDAAFSRSARAMGDKAAELVWGAQALRDAADIIRTAKIEQDDLNRHQPTEPPPYRPPVGPPTRADIRAESQSRQAHADYQAAYADHEARAKRQADAMDQVFTESAATMKKIHGEPDPHPKQEQGGGHGGSSGGSGGSGGSVPSGGGGGRGGYDGTRHHHPQLTPTIPDDTGVVPDHHPGTDSNPGSDPGSDSAVGAPQGGSPIDPVGLPATGGTPGGAVGAPGSATGGGLSAGTGLGLAGAAGGGAAGGLLGAGMSAGGIRGGLTPVVTNPGTAASGVRGIGATSRTGVAGGALGRSGGVGAASSGSGTGGRAGSASAAGRRGTSGGSRGAAGGRGTGSVASGRGGRGKDEKRRKRDVFDTGDEWVEDEDAAPSVLD